MKDGNKFVTLDNKTVPIYIGPFFNWYNLASQSWGFSGLQVSNLFDTM